MITETINANALHIPLSDQSVQCVVTSPPYYGLRDYDTDSQIGLEATPQEYVDNLVLVFRGVWRVLKDDGVLWLNLGDSYVGYKGKNYGMNPAASNLQSSSKIPTAHDLGTPHTSGLRQKNLIGIPWRVAFALQNDGWYLRQDIIWHKPNPMPESVTDRCTKAHEYVFLLTKNPRYFYDHEAIKEKSVRTHNGNRTNADSFKRNGSKREQTIPNQQYGTHRPNRTENEYDILKRNRRSVWEIATKPYPEAHFATFPPELVEPMILAGSRPGDFILDPFAGTATVGEVSAKHGRNFVGLEINPEYIILAQERTRLVQMNLQL